MPRSLFLVLLSLIVTTGWDARVYAADEDSQGPTRLHAADENGKGPAYTEPPEDDPNYSLMGEFVGEINAGEEGEKKLIGLQIRPVGNNEFDAVVVPRRVAWTRRAPRRTGSHDRPSLRRLRHSLGRALRDHRRTRRLPAAGSERKQVGRLERIERTSPTLGALPPKDAIVLFDGTNLDQFTNAQMTEDGLLMQGADLKPMFQDFNLHVEFRFPYMPQADGQARGNSGLYLQSRYECQILDSFALEPLFNGLGSLYRFKAPDLNMGLPPLVWQTYDVQFTAPRWAADGSKIRDAHITSWVNGVKVQDNVALPNKTGAGKQEEPLLLPTRHSRPRRSGSLPKHLGGRSRLGQWRVPRLSHPRSNSKRQPRPSRKRRPAGKQNQNLRPRKSQNRVQIRSHWQNLKRSPK